MTTLDEAALAAVKDVAEGWEGKSAVWIAEQGVRAYLEALPPAGWQPIETAPEFKEVLVGHFKRYEPDGPYVLLGAANDSLTELDEAGTMGWNDWPDKNYPPTHWTLLPPVPVEIREIREPAAKEGK